MCFDAMFSGWSYVHNYSNHRLGRIWVCWSDEVEVCHVTTSMQMITVWVKYKATGDTFLCSFVYASNYANERRKLWREMELIGASVRNNPWIIQGDFNVSLSMQEHSLSTATRMDMNAIREFKNAVQKCDMMDLAQVGPSFTWTNCHDDYPISKKLDQVMINSVWINEFPRSFVTFESDGVSDHLRMHTQLRDIPPTNMKPFKFFNHITGHPKFLETVEWVWNKHFSTHARLLGNFRKSQKPLNLICAA